MINIIKKYLHTLAHLPCRGGWVGSLVLLTLIASCARMGSPDGGWYDETPPSVVGTTPEDKGTNAKGKKVQIRFSEYIKLENAMEKLVISPPQIETPEIKAQGKRITIELKDTLKENTTYTFDFSDAIADNNEGNPMGSYTFSFSTGEQIDTLEFSGRVLNAENFEPIKGILVGLTTPDSVGGTMLRVSRTDSRGRFIIRGVAPGEYCCYALNDQDGNYRFSQRSEQLAFSHEKYTPSCRPDVRQDTLWIDSLHIKDIMQVGYTHFFPDEITLLAFTHDNLDRFYTKTERTEADRFTMFFTGPGSYVPEVKLLDYDVKDPFVIEATEKLDTVTYWLRDTMLVNRDTLNVAVRYEMTDTLGNIVDYCDTIPVLAKVPYAKRLKQHQEEVTKWEKELAKKRKKGEEIKDSIMPAPRLQPKYSVSQSVDPNATLRISFPAPLEKFDTAAIHIYCMVDSQWYKAPFDVQHSTFRNATERDWDITADWLPDTEYSFEIDTLAFADIYGRTSEPYKTGFKVRSLDEYASLFVNVSPVDSATVVVQLLDKSDNPVMESVCQDGTAEFYYVTPGTYYMRAFVDSNGNGRWDTGNFYEDRQPEQVYYYPEEFECKAKWDITKSWNLTQVPLHRQKPGRLIKQKADKEKTIKNRNAQRAAEKGILPPK